MSAESTEETTDGVSSSVQQPQQPQRTQQTETDDSRIDLSVGKVVAYIVGGLTVLAGVGQLIRPSLMNPVAGALYIVAGTFGLPPTRELIERKLNVRLSRWLAVLVYLVILVTAGAFIG
jgi:predicted membrane channel-forming protein YqfA (hemolysin III family)